ncbi:hypothetical protein BaRGS_00004830 [Batillaria attramentaria]|uniref:Uncharacterized protein n=1 Tax=Batillaria attramentaria TaxID=370345 RepID=A0ABD0LXE5_9CAEN
MSVTCVFVNGPEPHNIQYVRLQLGLVEKCAEKPLNPACDFHRKRCGSDLQTNSFDQTRKEAETGRKTVKSVVGNARDPTVFFLKKFVFIVMDHNSTHTTVQTNGGSLIYSHPTTLGVDDISALKLTSPYGSDTSDNNNEREQLNANIMPSAFGLIESEVH